jgi:hypothetical protein
MIAHSRNGFEISRILSAGDSVNKSSNAPTNSNFQGNNWLRGFDALTDEMLWKFDINPKSAKPNFLHNNQNNLIIIPIYYKNQIYFTTRQHFEFGAGQRRVACVDPTKRGDISSELSGANGVRPNPNSSLI